MQDESFTEARLGTGYEYEVVVRDGEPSGVAQIPERLKAMCAGRWTPREIWTCQTRGKLWPHAAGSSRAIRIRVWKSSHEQRATPPVHILKPSGFAEQELPSGEGGKGADRM